MTKEEKYLRDAGAWDFEQRTPHHIYTVGEHTQSVVQYCMEHGASDEVLKAAWLHDVGKLTTRHFDGEQDHFYNHAIVSAEIANHLGESEYVVQLIRYHDVFFSYSQKTIKKLAANGQKWCEDLSLLMLADLAGQHPTFKREEKLQKRALFLQSLQQALDRTE